jgi:hypothetical protein
LIGDAAWQEAFEERAAILEYCFHLPRREAEAQAREQLVPAVPPPLLPQEDKRTPSYMAFRDKWHNRTRKHF